MIDELKEYKLHKNKLQKVEQKLVE